MNTAPLRLLAALAETTEEPWRQDASCRETGVEMFFLNRRESTAATKRVCAGCEVRVECLQDALTRNERHGIRGGKTAKERQAIRRERKTQPKEAAA